MSIYFVINVIYFISEKKNLLKYTLLIIILNREGFSEVVAWYGAFTTFWYISWRF